MRFAVVVGGNVKMGRRCEIQHKKGIIQQHASKKGSQKVLETIFKKVLRRALRSCLTVVFGGRKGYGKGSQKGFLEGVLRRGFREGNWKGACNYKPCCDRRTQKGLPVTPPRFQATSNMASTKKILDELLVGYASMTLADPRIEMASGATIGSFVIGAWLFLQHAF